MFSRSAGDKLAMGAITALSLVMTGSSQLLWRRLQEHSIDGSPLDAWSLERLTGVALGLFGAAVIAWLLLSVALAVLAHLLNSAGNRHGIALASVVPGFVVRVVIAGLGGSLALSGCAPGVAPAGAAASVAAPISPRTPVSNHMDRPNGEGPGPSPSPASEPNRVEADLLSPGFVPRRVPLPLPRVAGATTRSSNEVVVQRGDSLWAIAARHLPDGAGVEQIASAWPHWYHANKQLIGSDPDLLEVGMVLRRPAPATTKH